MPVSPLTPLSLTAEVNLHRLRRAFNQLEDKEDFYIDPGIWCCRTCALDSAWIESNGRPFVFWHEQNEDALHRYPNDSMPLYFGIARDNASKEEIVEIARKIISVIEDNEIPCQWDGEDVEKCILVSLNQHLPEPPEVEGNEEDEGDMLDLALYLPKNKETEEYCWSESIEEDGEPSDTYHFYQRIEDGESIKDAFMRVDESIRKHIVFYQRCVTVHNCIYTIGPVTDINEYYGHGGSGDSLSAALADKDLSGDSSDADVDENEVWFKTDFRKWIRELESDPSQAEELESLRSTMVESEPNIYQFVRLLELLHKGTITGNDAYNTLKRGYSPEDVRAGFDEIMKKMQKD